MGSLISRWRSKPTIVEQLEELEKEIKSKEKLKLQNLQNQKKILGHLLLWSIILYISAAFLVYFLYFPTNWTERLLYSGPLLAFPFLIWGLRKLLHWYFVKRRAGHEAKVEELKQKKKEILEDVMENETYKKAKEILEKYDPERFKQIEKPMGSVAPTPRTPFGQDVRQRGIVSPTPGAANKSMGVTPRLPRQASLPVSMGVPPSAGGPTPFQRNGNHPPGTPYPQGPVLPRPILPRERTAVDKLVEYLVGDGPQNRFALICQRCQSHNGMAMKEEFEFLAFRCCYCSHYNAARRSRPTAPKLEPPVSLVTPATSPSRSQDFEEAPYYYGQPRGYARLRPSLRRTQSTDETESCSGSAPGSVHGDDLGVEPMEQDPPILEEGEFELTKDVEECGNDVIEEEKTEEEKKKQ